MKGRDKLLSLILFISFFILTACEIENPPDMIIINGKILTVDEQFTIAEALAIWTVVTRTTERNRVIMPSEAITREEALRMHTMNNAYASFEESIKGSLESGKLADLAILSDDLLDCPVNQIRDIQSELTIVGGKIVYSSEGE